MHSREESRVDLGSVAGGFTLHFWQKTETKAWVLSGCAAQPAAGAPQDELLLYMITVPGHKENQHVQVKGNLETYVDENTGIPKPFCFSDCIETNDFPASVKFI